MRISVLGLFIFIAILACLEAKRNKDAWRHKKQKHLAKFSKFGVSKDGGVDNLNEKEDMDFNHKPPLPPRNFHKKKLGRRMNDKYFKKKYGIKKHKKTTWLEIQPAEDCDNECKPRELCVAGPVNKKPLCIDKKDLKKSMKLFHRYHKKETKPWRKFQKQNYKKESKWMKKQERLERKKNAKIIALKKHYMKKYGHGDKMNVNSEEAMKELDLAEMMKQQGFSHTNPKETASETSVDKQVDIPKSSSGDECSANEFVQMRTRMMGWFHLLHGQDHLARKAHGGSIAKFYKHVSVKKELREHDGVKCGCLKSAMWQFHQLDKNANDHLTPDELAVIEEDSLEPCIKPYLTSCDISGDHKLSSDEWCCCFSHIVAPCFRKVDEIKKAGDKDVFIPRCDREGYYMREQCSSDENEKMLCWCVDINGNELKGTSTNGRAHCSKIALLNMKTPPFF